MDKIQNVNKLKNIIDRHFTTPCQDENIFFEDINEYDKYADRLDNLEK